MEGWVKLHRSISDHWIYRDAEYLKVWIEMLFRARFDEDATVELYDGQLIEVGYGEFIYGRIKWSQRLGISERRLRTLIKKMTQEDMIKLVKSANKFSVYSICNYEKYTKKPDDAVSEVGQDRVENAPKTDQQIDHLSDQQKHASQQGLAAISDQQTDQQNDRQETSKRPANDQQVTTKEEFKELKELQEIINTSSTNAFGQAYEMITRYFHQPNMIQQDDLDKYLKSGMEIGLLDEAIRTVKLDDKDLGWLFRILRNCDLRGIRTKQQFLDDQVQRSKPRGQYQQRNTYNKPTKPVIPVVKNEPQPHVSQEELDKAMEMARRLDSTRKAI